MFRKISIMVFMFLILCSIHYAQQTPADSIINAIAVLQPTEGHKVTGTITFTKVEDGIQVVADIKGLAPGKHGFHIHQYGNLSSPDGKSAGDHFNPTSMRHAGPDDAQHHMGDMGNITANSDGTAHLDMKINADMGSIIGRSVIVHEKEDDLMSQPAGNAGARLAVGVIGIADGNTGSSR